MMIEIRNLSKDDELYKYSNPILAEQKAKKYLGSKTILYKSNNKNKKYAVIDDKNHIINFGQLGYEDYTKHNSLEKRNKYLKRATNIKGNWKDNKYSPNNLSINILW
jgi:hypothetical protein